MPVCVCVCVTVSVQVFTFLLPCSHVPPWVCIKSVEL